MLSALLSFFAVLFFPDLSFGLFGRALGFFGQLLIVPLTYLVARFVLNLNRTVDALPPIAKRAVVFLLAIAVAGAYQYLGQALPPECSAVVTGNVTDSCWGALATPSVLRGLVMTFVAHFLHELKKANPRT